MKLYILYMIPLFWTSSTYYSWLVKDFPRSIDGFCNFSCWDVGNLSLKKYCFSLSGRCWLLLLLLSNIMSVASRHIALYKDVIYQIPTQFILKFLVEKNADVANATIGFSGEFVCDFWFTCGELFFLTGGALLHKSVPNL